MNQGPYNIRNALLPEAKGQIIAYHDADDLALPSRISSQLNALRAESANACFTNWVRVRPSGVVQVFRDQGVRRLSLISLMAHRAVIESLGGFRSARFAADREFYLRLTDSPVVRMTRVRAPRVLGLWSSQSLTQASGSESLASGFRALPRRAYAAAVFEQRLLGTIFTTDVPINPATVAFLYKVTVQEASDLLQQAAVASVAIRSPTCHKQTKKTDNE